MSMQKAQRQMPAQAGREAVGQGEAMPDAFSDEAFCPRHATGDTGSALLQAALTTENLRRAFKRVRANKGAAGVDGLDINQTASSGDRVAVHSRATAGRDVPAQSGASGDDPQTRRWRARAWHPDGDGSPDPASTATGAATDT